MLLENKFIDLFHNYEKSSVKIQQKIRYKNCIDLSSKDELIYINYIELEETVINKRTGVVKITNYSWITNIPIKIENAHEIMRMGRARWKIENETFNTLKNQGYNFEHNFGHGCKNLANNMGIFMLLAFLIDQIQQSSCQIYKTIITTAKVRKRVFDRIRAFFTTKILKSFNELYDDVLNIYEVNRKIYSLIFCDTT